MRFCLALVLAIAGCRGVPDPPTTPSRPNIVLINADDLGFGDLGCYGATKLRTPRIDGLARAGRRFTDAHSASAVCSPSRYGLLTGRYPLRHNFWGPAAAEQPLTIEHGRRTLASLLRARGYATGCIGKWHLGFGTREENAKSLIWNRELAPGPLEVGFDSYFGIPTVNSGPPFVFVEDHRVVDFDPKDPFVRGKRSVTQVWPAKSGYRRYGGAEAAHRRYRDESVGSELVGRAVDWLRATDRSRPFFLYFATTNIHHPFTPAPRFRGTSECGVYGDFVHELDWMVGRILDVLEDLGVAEQTLVIFTSDNGGMLNAGGQEAWRKGHRLNGELLGFKFGAWEGGHRVPFVVRWPGVVPRGTVCDGLVSQVDLLATFAALTGPALPEDVETDSRDVSSLFRGEPGVPREQLVVSPNSPRHVVVREREWVYIPARGEGGFSGRKPGGHLFGGPPTLPFTGFENSDIVDGRVREGAPPAQLYDLARDPRQTNNVHDDHPDVVLRMRRELARLRELVRGPSIGWIDPGNRARRRRR